MYPYTKELTLDEAQTLQQKIKAGEMPDIEIYFQYFRTDDHHGNLGSYYLDRCYKDNNNAILLTALDYATHILNQLAPPEGWGYAAYPLDSGKYDKLPYLVLVNSWGEGWYSQYKESITFSKEEWIRYAFKLTDLARVEAEKPEVKSTPPIADWEGTAFPERPDAIRPAKQEQTFGQFVGKVLEKIDWEAKYNSLLIDEKQLQEERNTWRDKYSELADRFNAQAQDSSNLFLDATEKATLQDSLLEAQNTIAIQEKRIRDLEHYKSISDDYVKAFERREAAKENLKQAEINLIEARNEYYPY